jgi:hypothetical protein
VGGGLGARAHGRLPDHDVRGLLPGQLHPPWDQSGVRHIAGPSSAGRAPAGGRDAVHGPADRWRRPCPGDSATGWWSRSRWTRPRTPLASEIAISAPAAVAAARGCPRCTPRRPGDRHQPALDAEMAQQRILMDMADFREGVRVWREKRTPEFGPAVHQVTAETWKSPVPCTQAAPARARPAGGRELGDLVHDAVQRPPRRGDPRAARPNPIDAYRARAVGNYAPRSASTPTGASPRSVIRRMTRRASPCPDSRSERCCGCPTWPRRQLASGAARSAQAWSGAKNRSTRCRLDIAS